MSIITVDNFKNYFYRDFAFASVQSDTTKIIDQDIVKAIDEATINFNAGLWEDETEKVIAFTYLTAFFLVLDINNSSAGLRSSFTGFTKTKKVGNVSEGYYIPEWLMNSPIYAIYMENGYGKKYLSMLYPRLAGAVLLFDGGTTVV